MPGCGAGGLGVSTMQTHALLHQSLFSFQCPPEPLAAIQRFASDLAWETVPRRGENKKAGRSYIHPAASLQAVEALNELHVWMTTCLNRVREQVGWRSDTVRELAISQSWLNRSDTGEEHHRHHHPLSILSGIMYLSEPSSTRFYTPSIYALPRVIAPDKTSGQMEIEVEFEGRLGQFVVFPSTLKHAVGTNLEPHARLTMSINSWFSGPIGRDQELAYIPDPRTGSSASDSASSA